jgi:type IV pilus assembly protein PilV
MNLSHRALGGQQGFSMLEVLVSVVILSMGLLGLTGLSLRSLAATDSSGYRAQAALKAMQMADVLRGNRQAVVNSSYDISFAGVLPSDPRASQDVTAWRSDLASIPGGLGAIDYDLVTQQAKVTVQWDDTRADKNCTTGACREYSYVFKP